MIIITTDDCVKIPIFTRDSDMNENPLKFSKCRAATIEQRREYFQ